MTEEEYNAQSRRDAATSADKGSRPKVSYLPYIHRLLPQAPDAEQGLLCSILLMPREVLDLCSEHSVTHDWMHIPAHSTLFSEILSIDAKGKPVDFITLSQALSDKGLLDQVGGGAFISGLFAFIPTAANASYYIEILKEKFVKRQANKIATGLVEESYDDSTETEPFLEIAQKALTQICEYAQGKKVPKSMKELVMESVHRLEEAFESPERIRGISTGLPDLDEATGGLLDGETIVIAGSTTQGKTALAMTIARHIAVDLKLPIGFISLEMSDSELTDRLMCMQSGIDLRNYIHGRLQPADFPRVTHAASLIAESVFVIEDEPGMGIHVVSAKARKMKQKHGIRALFVDYLQLVGRNEKRRGDETIVHAITNVSGALKQLAKELGIPIVELSQLAEDGSVKWAKAIAEDANNVWGISHDTDISEIVIKKARNGPRDIHVPVWFDKPHVRFWPSHMAPPKPAKPPTKKK